MLPMILAAIGALKSKRDQKQQQRDAQLQAAAQGEAYKYPGGQNHGLADAASLAGGLIGGDTGKTLSSVGTAMGGSYGGVGNALGGLAHGEPDAQEPDNDYDDMFGGIGR